MKEVQVIQWNGVNETIDEIVNFTERDVIVTDKSPRTLIIGNKEANLGDYIVKTKKGKIKVMDIHDFEERFLNPVNIKQEEMFSVTVNGEKIDIIRIKSRRGSEMKDESFIRENGGIYWTRLKEPFDQVKNDLLSNMVQKSLTPRTWVN
jgi:hypothetical protein